MAARPLYRLIVTDRTYKPLQELRNFGGFQFSRVLSKLATCNFTMRLDNPFVDLVAPAAGFIKVYRDNVLVSFNHIITTEEVADRESQTLAVTCADAGWLLSKRLAGKSGPGFVQTTALDRALIAKALVDTTNTMQETGINTAPTPAMSAGSATTYKTGPYRPILDALTELGAPLDGFDWWFDPIDNWSGGALTGSKISFLRALPVIGANKPGAVFEYGASTRSNVLSYSKITSREGQANRVFHLGNDPYNPIAAGNGATTAAQTAWGILEDVVQGELIDTTMRQKLVDEHINVRGFPRNLISMTPHIDPNVTGRLPRPFVDYNIGDWITFRAIHARKVRFAGTLRVYGIRINVEQESGFERVELILQEES